MNLSPTPTGTTRVRRIGQPNPTQLIRDAGGRGIKVRNASAKEYAMNWLEYERIG